MTPLTLPQSPWSPLNLATAPPQAISSICFDYFGFWLILGHLKSRLTYVHTYEHFGFLIYIIRKICILVNINLFISKMSTMFPIFMTFSSTLLWTFLPQVSSAFRDNWSHKIIVFILSFCGKPYGMRIHVAPVAIVLHGHMFPPRPDIHHQQVLIRAFSRAWSIG